jgi:outer membrane protein assembly factor BamD (BamD/ComL family)
MSAFETMLATRREGYEERLPRARQRLATLDLEGLRRRFAEQGARLDAIEQTGDAFGLATAREQASRSELDGLAGRIARLPSSPEVEQLRTRVRVLRGMVGWQVEQAYKIRLWEVRKHLAALADDIEALAARRDGLDRAQRDAPARFEGFDARIADLRDRVTRLRQRVALSVAAHERYLQGLAVAELERQKRRLDGDRALGRHQLARLLDGMALAAAGDAGAGARQGALRAWQDYLAAADDDEGRREAMRRIPDLELAISEEAPPGADRDRGFQAAIDGYHALLARYPDYPKPDDVAYQLARAYEGAGDNARSVETLAALAASYRDSDHYYEAEFRIGEDLFIRNDYAGAERAYRAVLAAGAASVFHEQALYKHGWSEFRLGRFEAALDDFNAVLATELAGEGGVAIVPDDLPRAQRELVGDVLRAASLSFDHLGGASAVAGYYARRGPAPYEHLVYAGLADLYLDRERPVDAARTLHAFVDARPESERAPLFQVRVYEVYEQAGLEALAAEGRRDFLTRFGLRSAYWKTHELGCMPAVAQRLRQELLAMAQRAHAEAQRGRREADYAAAAQWYRDYLEFFPKDEASPGLSFMLGELLREGGRYPEAIASYERSAYDYESHAKAAEAGYAALLAYDRYLERLPEGAGKTQWRGRAIDSALRFAGRFPDHPEAAAVTTKAAQDLLALGQPDRAAAAAQRVLDRKPAAEPALRLSAWMVIGAIRFDAGAFAEAEAAYGQAMTLAATATADTRTALSDRLAASIYRQGEAALAQGDPLAAARHFLRVAAAAPGASIAETADYDGATALIAAADWDGAVSVLDAFRRKYPDSRWQPEVTSKLALAYLQGGKPARAAEEFERIGRQSPDRAVAREASWQSAELYAKAGDDARALAALERYVTAFPQPLDRAIEARWRIAEQYRARGDAARREQWLRGIVEADAAAGAARSDFSRDTAARAALVLAEPLRADFERVRIQAPLERSLKVKKQAMEKAIGAFRQAAGYGAASVTTAATFNIAEIYHDFSRAVLDSQRPADLSGEEREQYDVLLEEQAYPFEEESIKLHEVNFRRIAQGVYDQWVRASMDQLAILLPARYAKNEKEVPFVEDIR